MTCADDPCQHGGVCTDAVQTCNNDADPACGFTCQCPDFFVGHLCHFYRRCYDDARVCYQTDYEKHGFSDASAHCLRQGNLTKPVVLNRAEATSLRAYIENDPVNQLMSDSVWLAAETHRLPDDNHTVYWQWLDGLETSTGTPLIFTARRVHIRAMIILSDCFTARYYA